MTKDSQKECRKFEAVVIGASAGGLSAIGQILSGLDQAFPFPVLVTKHIGSDGQSGTAEVLAKETPLAVKEAMDKHVIVAGQVYLAPSNYHMLVEDKELICLNSDERVCHVRPAVDVLFQSAADVYKDRLIAVILTGANNDGAEGVKAVKKKGGLTIVQSLESAEVMVMPKAAIATNCIDYVLPLDEISIFLNSIGNVGH